MNFQRWALPAAQTFRFLTGLQILVMIPLIWYWIKIVVEDTELTYVVKTAHTLAIVGSMIGPIIWWKIYGQTIALLRAGRAKAEVLTRMGTALLIIFGAELVASLITWMWPGRSVTIGDSQCHSSNPIAICINEKVFTLPPEYLSPITHGWATLVLAAILLTWARTLQELDEVI